MSGRVRTREASRSASVAGRPSARVVKSARGSRPRRAASVQAPVHKFDSPKSAAIHLLRKPKGAAKAKGKSGSTKKKKGEKGPVAVKHKDGRLKRNGLFTVIVDGEEVVRDAATLRAAAKAAAAAEDGEELPTAPVRLTIADKIRMAFDLTDLQERLDAEVERMTKLNAEALTPDLQSAVDEANQLRKEAEAQQEPADEEAEEAEADAESSPSDDEDAAPAAAAAASAQQSSRGRQRRKPQEAGAPLANYWGGSTSTKKKVGNNWNSDAYRERNRLAFQKFHAKAPGSGTSAAASASAPALATAAAASAAASSFVAASAQPAAKYTSSSLDPLGPDRVANEIFQIDPELRLLWKDPAQRLMQKLMHMPTTEFDRFEGFQLPFDQFGDAMGRLQKKDVPPKFTLVTRNKLSVTREFFNAAMGVAPRKVRRGDDDGAHECCTCQWRDHADAPKPGSKAALAESAAGKSFNCGEDCHNYLLMVECTAENCNLEATGKGDACANRKFAKVDYFPGCEPFKTEFKGWGVRCTESDIPADTFIYEYVGEIITNGMCQERMAEENERIRRLNENEMKKRQEIRKKEHKKRLQAEEKLRQQQLEVSRNNPNNDGKKNDGKKRDAQPRASSRPKRLEDAGDLGGKKKARSTTIQYDAMASDDEDMPAEYMEGEGPKSSNFYFLTIGEDVIIDAGARGGIARFTNHSCNANCSIQKWTVDGQVRIGIFSNQKIPRGRELTIDYKYDRVGNVHRQACFCGEPNCAKFIGGKKREIEGPATSKRSKKAKEPTRLDLEDADEVCPVCGDGGDLLLCDGKMCGSFCTRGYHPKCVALKAEDIPNTWICPYHFCDECGRAPKYFCHSCSQSACEKCWLQSREPDAAEKARLVAIAKNDVASTLHQTKVRRDLTNYLSNVWVCCEECQVDPMCLRGNQRQEFYDEQESLMCSAIEQRRNEDPSFGAGATAAEIYLAMYKGEFTPAFQCNYWNVSQQKPGQWTDGYVSQSTVPAAEEEETDEQYLARDLMERRRDEQGGDDEEEEEEEEQSPSPQAPAAAASASSSLASAASAAAPVVPAAEVTSDVAPMEIDGESDNEAASSPAPASAKAPRVRVRKPKASKKKTTAASEETPLVVRIAIKRESPTATSLQVIAPAAVVVAAPAPTAGAKRGRRSNPVTEVQRPASPVARASSPSASVTLPRRPGRPSKKPRVDLVILPPPPPPAAAAASFSPSPSPVVSASAAPTTKRVSAPKRKRKDSDFTDSASSSGSEGRDSPVDPTGTPTSKRPKRASVSGSSFNSLQSLCENDQMKLTLALTAGTGSSPLPGTPAASKLLAAAAASVGTRLAKFLPMWLARNSSS